LVFLIPSLLLDKRDKIVEYIEEHNIDVDTSPNLWYNITNREILPPMYFIFVPNYDRIVATINNEKNKTDEIKSTYENRWVEALRKHKEKFEVGAYKDEKTFQSAQPDAVIIKYWDNYEDIAKWTNDVAIIKILRTLKQLNINKKKYIISTNIAGNRYSRAVCKKKKVFKGNTFAFARWNEKMTKPSGFAISRTTIKIHSLSRS